MYVRKVCYTLSASLCYTQALSYVPPSMIQLFFWSYIFILFSLRVFITIVGIAASLLGATRVVLTDYTDAIVRNAQQNILRNNCQAKSTAGRLDQFVFLLFLRSKSAFLEWRGG